MSEERSRVVSHGLLVSEGTFFEAAETITVPVLTEVPKGKYDAAYLSAAVTVGRGSTLGIEGEDRTQCLTADGVVYRTRVPEAGLLRRLTREKRYLRVKYDRETQTPLVRFVPGQEDASDEPKPPPGPLTVEAPPKTLDRSRLPPTCEKKWDPPVCKPSGPTDCSEDPPFEDFNQRLSRFYGLVEVNNKAVVSLP